MSGVTTGVCTRTGVQAAGVLWMEAKRDAEEPTVTRIGPYHKGSSDLKCQQCRGWGILEWRVPVPSCMLPAMQPGVASSHH